MSNPIINRLNSSDAGFSAAYARLLQWDAGDQAQIEATVADIIADVKSRGDRALIDYTARFDKIELTPESRCHRPLRQGGA